MSVRTDFPFAVELVENCWIPLADGTRLAARLWLPDGARDRPVPALFEFLPYRKNDGTAIRDARRQAYFAGHGYAAVRVDMRGSGDSDGLLSDEYTEQEHEDALEILRWIAAQPWCDGNIGMHGISWGGFNSLQVAARQPPELKALLVIGFTDDRYHDDVHYMGGCLLTQQMLSWSSVMFAYNAAPPDPRFVGERWRELWFQRMAANQPWVETWVAHQRRDDYWRHGSICEDYSAIQVPVYAVGGWADSYNNSIPRLLQQLQVPRKGLIGPWCHTFPEVGEPGPAIGFLQESLRWWDHWLKGIDTGIMNEPMLRSWIQDSLPPARYYDYRPGRWVAEPGWPSPHVRQERLWLAPPGQLLRQQPERETTRLVRTPLTHTLDAGEWGSYGVAGEYPGDQRAADGEAVSFTTEPAGAPTTILGNPVLHLRLSADQPWGLVAVRLCDVAPTGESALVSWGLLNLTHRHGDAEPKPLQPGEWVNVAVSLNVCGHRLPAGHRWRVAVSSNYVRHAWPSPRVATLKLALKHCWLALPVRADRPEDADLPPFPEPEYAPLLEIITLRTPARQQTIERDLVHDRLQLRTVKDDGRLRYPDGIETDDISTELISLHNGDPLSVEVQIQAEVAYARGDWQVRIKTDSKMSADAAFFHLTNFMEAYEGATRVFSRHWQRQIPRDFI